MKFFTGLKNYAVVLLILFAQPVLAQTLNLEREFRGAWIATVVNLDWPSKPGLPVSKQKEELKKLLDMLASLNFNAVIFQVRPECDALYKSDIEPWSYWLTGKQGKAPQPFYDPLEFAITESHKRGMELHAWINPYRAVRKTGTYKISAKHVTRKHPEWIITSGKLKYLNPGLPEVRNYVKNVFEEIIKNYDVDGIHFDDYFYPYPPNEINNEDIAAFARNPRGFRDISDWRRDNVNLLIKEINNAIKNIKPFVKFGVSPFGIWKNNVPKGIKGFDAYSRIYADAVSWIGEGSIDYLVPQLYWPFGGGQDFAKLAEWWSLQRNDSQVYGGLALYRAGKWRAAEIPEQIKFLRENPFADGYVFFRAANLFSNPKGVSDSLFQTYMRYGAIPPVFYKWNINVPGVPKNLQFMKISDSQGRFEWYGRSPNVRYVILTGKIGKNRSTYLGDNPNILYLTDNNYFNGSFIRTDIELNYAVVSVNSAGVESGISNIVSAPPLLMFSNYKKPGKFSIRVLRQLNEDFYDFEFEVPEKQHLVIWLKNSFGRTVAKFAESKLEAGVYKTFLPADILQNGVYYFTVFYKNNFLVKKILLLKG